MSPVQQEQKLSREAGEFVEWVEATAKMLVDHPDEVRTEVIEGENSVIITLGVDSRDLGCIIGKGGQNAKAMRRILIGAGAKLRKKVVLHTKE